MRHRVAFDPLRVVSVQAQRFGRAVAVRARWTMPFRLR